MSYGCVELILMIFTPLQTYKHRPRICQGPDRKDIERDSRAIVALITVNKEAEAHYQV